MCLCVFSTGNAVCVMPPFLSTLSLHEHNYPWSSPNEAGVPFLKKSTTSQISPFLMILTHNHVQSSLAIFTRIPSSPREQAGNWRRNSVNQRPEIAPARASPYFPTFTTNISPPQECAIRVEQCGSAQSLRCRTRRFIGGTRIGILTNLFHYFFVIVSL